MNDLTHTQLLDHELSMIRHYAIEHHLNPKTVSDYFSVGIAAAKVLASDEREEVADERL